MLFRSKLEKKSPDDNNQKVQKENQTVKFIEKEVTVNEIDKLSSKNNQETEYSFEDQSSFNIKISNKDINNILNNMQKDKIMFIKDNQNKMLISDQK